MQPQRTRYHCTVTMPVSNPQGCECVVVPAWEIVQYRSCPCAVCSAVVFFFVLSTPSHSPARLLATRLALFLSDNFMVFFFSPTVWRSQEFTVTQMNTVVLQLTSRAVCIYSVCRLHLWKLALWHCFTRFVTQQQHSRLQGEWWEVLKKLPSLGGEHWLWNRSLRKGVKV